jgi:hypothetical protein
MPIALTLLHRIFIERAALKSPLGQLLFPLRGQDQAACSLRVLTEC